MYVGTALGVFSNFLLRCFMEKIGLFSSWYDHLHFLFLIVVGLEPRGAISLSYIPFYFLF